MKTLFLSSTDIKLPDNVSGIDSTDMIREGNNLIEAGCEASGGKIIQLTKIVSNEISGIVCSAKNGNSCVCPNVDSDTCVIKIKKILI